MNANVVEPRRVQRSQWAVRLLKESALVLISLVFLYPVLLVFMNSFKPYGEIIEDLLAIPKRLTLENYVRVLSTPRYFVSVSNSILYVIVFAPTVAVLSCMAGYMIGRTDDRKSRFILGLFMISMAIPGMSTMLPLFSILGKLKLINTRMGYIIVSIPRMCPAYIFFYSAHVKSIPRELEEAAVIDGCGLVRCFISIVFPLCISVTAMVAVLIFLGVWNDYLLPSLILRDQNLHTVTMMLQKFQGEYGTKWDMMLTCAALTMAPSLLLYLFAQKYIMKGLLLGAVKG